MTSFTKGPWEIDGAQVCIPGGCALADVHGANEKAEANVRLIAAAPEMYELLNRYLREGESNTLDEEADALIARIDEAAP